MSIDDVLLIARIVFVASLYVFLFVLAMLLRRELRTTTTSVKERAPADLMVVEPFETGLEPGERLPLMTVSSVGRNDDNDIVLADTFVSSEHARLSWNGKAWVLEDVGSTNGTRLNGKAVRRTARVKFGDVVEFGRVKAKLVAA